MPRPAEIIEGNRLGLPAQEMEEIYATAVADTVAQLEACGATVVTDGEQRKPSFATYVLQGFAPLAPDGVAIAFADGHIRRLPRLTGGPFRSLMRADCYVKEALRHATVPVKQAVISASALSLLYPAQGLPDYSRELFLSDLVAECAAEIRACLEAGAVSVQIDMTEARLSVKLDPSRALLRQFVALNNQVLGRLTPQERQRVGVHTCPGSDLDSCHSADVDYADLFPELFRLEIDTFYLSMATEKDPRRVLALLREYAGTGRRFFLGVIDPCDPRVETPEVVRDRVLLAAQYLPVAQLGTTDDCGFSPFGDDASTSREKAFRKITARIKGTQLAAAVLGI